MTEYKNCVVVFSPKGNAHIFTEKSLPTKRLMFEDLLRKMLHPRVCKKCNHEEEWSTPNWCDVLDYINEGDPELCCKGDCTYD